MVNSEYGIFQLCKWLISLIYWYHLVNGMDPSGYSDVFVRSSWQNSHLFYSFPTVPIFFE